ncbi:hypothetical protein BJV74DRAFT_519424 [Russula compacta]|nr:hypothetical protein BJV74DRAFT_519424 [Russula compacta]
MPSLRAVLYNTLLSEGEGGTCPHNIPSHRLWASVSFPTSDLSSVCSASDAILSLPRSHPLRASSVESLAMTLLARRKLSGRQDDLEQSTLYLTEMIFLPLIRDAGCSPAARRCHTAPSCTFRYLRQQSFEAFNVPRCHVTEFLAHALAVRVRLEAGDGIGDIEEMAVLCSENTPENTPADCIAAVIEAVCGQLASLFKGQEPPPRKVIEFLREANGHTIRDARLFPSSYASE